MVTYRDVVIIACDDGSLWELSFDTVAGYRLQRITRMPTP